jgi:hypothetical protein
MSGTPFYRLALVGAVAAPVAMLAMSRTTAAPPPSIVEPRVEVDRGKQDEQVPTFRQRWEPFIETTAVPLDDVAVRSASPPMPRPRLREQPRATDVCARHGMRKVTTGGGRSWRCRRMAEAAMGKPLPDPVPRS